MTDVKLYIYEQYIADILNDIETRRQAVHTSSNVLNDIVRHLTGGLHSVARQIEGGLERVQRYDFWRWILMLGNFPFHISKGSLYINCRHARPQTRSML